MDLHPTHQSPHYLSLPTITSLVRLLPLTLLFFLTTPHNFAEHIHALYTDRPIIKPPPREPSPSKRGDVDLHVIPLPLGNPTVRSSILLQPGTSLYASLRPPALCTPRAPCSALLETWYDHTLPRDFKPDPYFLAANGDVPQPPSFSRLPVNCLADDEAFLIWRPYHYLYISSIHSSDNWHIRILNKDTTVFNDLNATLRVTIVHTPSSPPSTAPSNRSDHSSPTNSTVRNPPAPQLLCPSGPVGVPCSAHGACAPNGVCACHDGWGGRYCETQVLDLPTQPFNVEPDAMRVFKYVAPNRSNVVTVLELLSPATVSPQAHPILFAKPPGANGGNDLSVGPPLPTIYDIMFTDTLAIQNNLRVQRVVTHNVRQGDTILIGVYNFYNTFPAWLIRRNPNFRRTDLVARRFAVTVLVRAYPCVERMPNLKNMSSREAFNVADIHMCPSQTLQYWELSLRSMVFPIVLGFVTLITLIVCVSVWAGVFRQHMLDTLMGPAGANGMVGMHERAMRRDKLSESEVNAMFPAFLFTKGEADALCAVGDASCSICLCVFEEDEYLRRLACGHSYHSDCLDQWLLTNATCPRCRKSARIQGESFRSGAALRRSVRAGIARAGAALAWVRNSCSMSLCGGGGVDGDDLDDLDRDSVLASRPSRPWEPHDDGEGVLEDSDIDEGMAQA